MKQLFIKSIRKIEQTSLNFQRSLIQKINWKNRLIAIKGARGSGKTTLLLQYIKLNLPKDDTVLYVAMDELFFMENNLIEMADEFVLNGGTHLFLDEVHKYPNWSREIKLIYDSHTHLNVVFTSSSILEVYKSESDLSRRAVDYFLPELSIREFIELKYQTTFPKLKLEEILRNHEIISREISGKIKPVVVFKKFVEYGAYPYFIQGVDEYQQKLMNVINLILEVDLVAVENIDFQQITKIKKLLFAIATSVPFTPNITKISEKVDLSRPSLLKALHYLQKARLIEMVNKSNKGMSAMSKPNKIYLNNPNLAFALAPQNTQVGNIRETFFVNQLRVVSEVNLSEKGDFLVNGKYTFEIGGKDKTGKQIAGVENSFLVKDDLEYGFGNSIPLWLFGFLY